MRVGDKVMTGRGPGTVKRLKESFAYVELSEGDRGYFCLDLLRPLNS